MNWFCFIPYREPIIQLPKQLWCSRCPSRAAEHRWFIIDINFVFWSCILKHSDWIWNQNVHDLQLTPWKFPQGFVHPGDCVYLYAKSWYSWTIPRVTKWSAIWEANQPDRQERKTEMQQDLVHRKSHDGRTVDVFCTCNLDSWRIIPKIPVISQWTTFHTLQKQTTYSLPCPQGWVQEYILIFCCPHLNYSSELSRTLPCSRHWENRGSCIGSHKSVVFQRGCLR